MWTLTLNKFRKFFISAALWAFLPALAAASAIDHVSVVFNGGNQNFVAGIATNTTGSGQIWIEAFTASGSTPHDVGEKIALEILKDGVVVPNAISPSYVTIKDTFTVIY